MIQGSRLYSEAGVPNGLMQVRRCSLSAVGAMTRGIEVVVTVSAGVGGFHEGI